MTKYEISTIPAETKTVPERTIVRMPSELIGNMVANAVGIDGQHDLEISFNPTMGMATFTFTRKS